MPTPRRKPVLSLTFEPDTVTRLDALVALLPGSTRSGVADEVMQAGLPVFEQMAQAMTDAKRPDGSLDEQKARDAVAQWAGAQLLGMYDSRPDADGKE